MAVRLRLSICDILYYILYDAYHGWMDGWSDAMRIFIFFDGFQIFFIREGSAIFRGGAREVEGDVQM